MENLPALTPTIHHVTGCVTSTYLFAAVEEPLSFGLHLEELLDLEAQLVHLGELGQVVHPVGLAPVHRPYLDPHCSCPGDNGTR